MSGRRQEVICFLWPLQREGTWNEHEKCCVDEALFKLWCWTLLKMELFLSDIGNCLRAVEDGIFGVFINPFISLYFTQVLVVGPQGSSKVFRNTSCSLTKKSTKNRIFFHSDIKT